MLYFIGSKVFYIFLNPKVYMCVLSSVYIYSTQTIRRLKTIKNLQISVCYLL